jgi:hypothetical protein
MVALRWGAPFGGCQHGNWPADNCSGAISQGYRHWSRRRKRFLHQMVGALLSMAGAASLWALNLTALGEEAAATASD